MGDTDEERILWGPPPAPPSLSLGDWLVLGGFVAIVLGVWALIIAAIYALIHLL